MYRGSVERVVCAIKIFFFWGGGGGGGFFFGGGGRMHLTFMTCDLCVKFNFMGEGTCSLPKICCFSFPSTKLPILLKSSTNNA